MSSACAPHPLRHGSKRRRAFPTGTCLAWLLAAGPAAAHELVDLRTFRPPSAEERKIVSPTVRWWVRENAESFCATAPDQDGFATTAGGCVFWRTGKSTCTLVTGPTTTHSVLGHLLLHCLKTGAGS